MSGEERDRTYKTKGRAEKTLRGTPRRTTTRTTGRIDYKETEVISSGSDSEETIVGSESGIGSSKLEREDSVPLLEGDRDRNLWTPGTLTSRDNQVTEQLSRLATVNTDLAMARETEKSGLERVMEMMLQMRVEDRKEVQLREEKREREERQREVDRLDRITRLEAQREKEDRDREERRLEREAKRDEEIARREQLMLEREETRLREQKDMDLRREERLLTTLKEAQPAVPQQVTIQTHKLPDMKENDEAELFVTMFEAALLSNLVPENQWKNKLHAHLSMKAKSKIHKVMQDQDSTYEEIKEALLGCTSMSFSSAAEEFCTGEKGRLVTLEPRQAIEKMSRLVSKITRGAGDIQEAEDLMVVAETRSWLVPTLKTYVDMSKQFGLQDYIRTIEEWERSQPVGTPCFKRIGPQQQPMSYKQNLQSSHPYKKSVNCYHCGKAGHMSRDCRTRIANEKQVTPSQPREQVPTTTPSVPNRTEKKPVVCFTCHMKGHKSPQCPQKVTTVKRIQIPVDRVVPLKHNEVLGSIAGHRLPITCDSGADITVVPEECVDSDQFTGETCAVAAFNKIKTVGKLCDIQVQVGDHVFKRRAVTQPG